MALWLLLCDWLKLGGMLRGTVGALLPILITGGIHMDGFMDTSDAMASWQPKERRLEILKDSHVGAFAVLGCAGYLLLHAALLSEASATSGALLCCVFVLSRALSAWAMATFRSARPQGMLDAFAQAAHRRMVTISCVVYAVLCAVVWFVFGGCLTLVCLLAAALCVIYYRHMAYKQFGGVTGDLAGWFLQVTELALTAVIVLGGKL
jgi:adenosylcobinamide-GDP ribazoletransferase